MELHPIIDSSASNLIEGVWYVLDAKGKELPMIVGHVCVLLANEQDSSHSVYVIGGANPSRVFNLVHRLDCESLRWQCCSSEGFKARYEHAAFVINTNPVKVCVFAGANLEGNFNDIQLFDTHTQQWSTIEVTGEPPPARTCHSAASVNGSFVVFGGGHAGSEPVHDEKVHVFDPNSRTWTVPDVVGSSPKPRQGHVMVAVDDLVYVHGGMSNSTFYDDLHVLDLQASAWKKISQGKNRPTGRAGHGAIAYDSKIYVFGGLNQTGALDDLFVLNTVTLTWSKVELHGPPPSPRLDFGMCVAKLKLSSDLKVRSSNGQGDSRVDSMETSCSLPMAESSKLSTVTPSLEKLDLALQESHVSTKTLPTETNTNEESTDVFNPPHASMSADETSVFVDVIFILGGMDTNGEIFNDCFIMKL